MGQIILLAFGAAVFPTLLACVAIMISRPSPRRLLLAFYLGGLIVSIASGLVVLHIFEDGDTALGSSSSAPQPWVSIVLGAVVLLLAWLMLTDRGRMALDAWRARHPREVKHNKGPSWPQRHLGAANAKVAFAVGAAINLPGPFYLLALGDIATGGYSNGQQIALILLFNAIMFLLIEVPLAGYLVRPDETAAKVAALSRWLNANGLRVMGALVGVMGLGLVVQGAAALAG